MSVDETLSNAIIQEIDFLKSEMYHYNRWLYDNPEEPKHEYKAVEEICKWLQKHGFTIEPEAAGQPTAFVASYEQGQGGPQVGFLAEYDALPVVGHGCGHNIIASSSVGAGIALSRYLKKSSTAGKVIVYGCPDEEFDGGKVPMVEAGLFPESLDAALHIHPGIFNAMWGWTPNATSMLMKFYGRAAHTAFEPEAGINALHALLIAFRALDALRHHVKDGTRMPATITNGGGAPNAVPEYAEARIHLTTVEREHLLEVIEKVKNCGRGGAIAAGAEVEFWDGPIYENMSMNMTLGEKFTGHFKELGLDVLPEKPLSGSTDVGNVSLVTPTCAATIAVAKPGTKMHSKDFAQATISPGGEEALRNAALIMAKTAQDVILDSNLRDQIRKEFSARKG
ncbi:MAG: amidohydrolase [Firmicutes bacterium]|nr:amidohydrolase [Bacillota bacterium]